MKKNHHHPLRIVHTESTCGLGGQALRVLHEAAGIHARGHQVHIICPKESIIYPKALDMGIPVVPLPIARKKFSAVVKLWKWLRKNPADIINTHSSTDSWLTALATRFIHPKPKIIRTRHVSTAVTHNLPTRWLYKTATDRIVTTGETVRKGLLASGHYPDNKVISVPTGADEQLFLPGDKLAARWKLSLPEEPFIVGFLAAIRSWKGHIHLIRAIAKLNNPDIHLLIVGGNAAQDSRVAIENEIAKHNLSQRVIMQDHQEDVVPWLQSMDLFALPSYGHEGVPQSLTQAMLCQIAVISTPVGGISEMVIDQETGLLVTPQDSDQLASAIQHLVDSEQLRQTLAFNGRQHALNHCTTKIMIDRMESVFFSTLKQTHSS